MTRLTVKQQQALKKSFNKQFLLLRKKEKLIKAIKKTEYYNFQNSDFKRRLNNYSLEGLQQCYSYAKNWKNFYDVRRGWR